MTAAYNFGAASNFIVNITELQNTITSAGGASNGIASLSNAVARLQEMVIYDEKRIATNTISRFSASPIQVADSLNLAAGATITSNGEAWAGGSSSLTAIGAVGNVSSLTYYANTVAAGSPAISFQVGAPAQTPFQILGGGGLVFGAAGTPGVGKYLTCMDGLGTAEWQTPAMPSDARLKEDIRGLGAAEVNQILEGLHGSRFRWRGTSGVMSAANRGPTTASGVMSAANRGPTTASGVMSAANRGTAPGAPQEDIGLIAQDVQAVLPEAVEAGSTGQLMVHYYKVIPVLVEAIKGLERRVAELEAAARD
jgi:hypothetical protein